MRIPHYFSLSATIAGAFIGAGFVSGQEMWQFFGRYGLYGVIGLFISITGLVVLSFLVMRYALISGASTFITIISPSKSKTVKFLLLLLEAVFYFCIYIIMTAGARSLMHNHYNLDKTLASFIFVTVVSIISLSGVKKIISFFAAVTPLLTVSVLVISVFSITKNGFHLPETANGNFFFALLSSFLYISYNFIAGIGVLAALGRVIKNSKVLKHSSLLSFIFLAFLSTSILFGIFSVPESGTSDLPMITIANSVSPVLGIFYSVLLVFAMTGASVSSLFPIIQLVKGSISKKIVICTILSFLTVVLSSIGFKELISAIYPAFGYIGFIIIALVISNAIKTYKERI